jgi:hypothetical protein
LGVSIGVVGKDIREYQTKNQVVLPYQGTIHDIERAMTHKKILIGLYLKNIPTPDIARIIGHTKEACDRYNKAFKKVRTLYRSMNIQDIFRTPSLREVFFSNRSPPHPAAQVQFVILSFLCFEACIKRYASWRLWN